MEPPFGADRRPCGQESRLHCLDVRGTGCGHAGLCLRCSCIPRVDQCAAKRKDVKQIIAELNPVLRGWGTYFRTGTADRELNKMGRFAYGSLRRWQYRRGGQRPTRRPPFSGDRLHEMGLYRLMAV